MFVSLTPKALANSSPGLLQPWVTPKAESINPERVGESWRLALFANAFSVARPFLFVPRVVTNPGLELANAFGVLHCKGNPVFIRSRCCARCWAL
jgi:hypothetical protein